MKIASLFGLATLTFAVSGAVQAAPASKNVRVVAGATALTTAQKADVTGMCYCGEDPAPTPEVKLKPGYGFGAKTEHYGPPGQGFSPENTWRNWMKNNPTPVNTPNGHPLPPPTANPKPLG